MKRIDLHNHTSCSDGTDSPAELISAAKAAGLAAIAITDHDTVEGIPEAAKAGESLGVEVVPGVEMCTGFEHTEIHTLGYFIDTGNERLKNALKWVIDDRRERNEKMAAAMRADGLPVTAEELYARYPHSTLGRPHFGEKLIELGVVASVKESFEKYLNPGCKYYVRRHFIEFSEAVSVIHAAGGRAVLAHPFQYKYDDERLRHLLDFCAEAGMDGMECMYSGYTPEMQEYLMRLAGEYGLLITGGSDYHGYHKPHIKIGTGISGELNVPYELLEKLRR